MSTIHTVAYFSARVAEEFWRSVAHRIGKPGWRS